MPAPALYREYDPSAALAPWVAALWTVTGSPDQPAIPRRILPDGCADLIVDLDAGGSLAPVVVGAMRSAVVVRQTAPATVGVRFRPGAAAAFLGVPLRELTDRTVPLADLKAPAASAAALGCAAALDVTRLTGDPATSLARVEQALAARLDRVVPPDPLVTAAVAIVREAGGRLPMRALAPRLGVAERRLERLFDREVGLSPKLLARVMRLQRTRTLLRRHPARGGAWVAAEAGYADQAHMITDFRDLAGTTPAAYLRERAGDG